MTNNTTFPNEAQSQAYLLEAWDGSDGLDTYGMVWGDPEVESQLGEARLWIEDIPQDSSVLEIGSGGGRWTKYLARFESLKCVDGTPESERLIKSYLKKKSIEKDFEFITSPDGQLSQVPTGSIDYVFSFATFVHFSSELFVNYLNSLSRIVKPGGRVHLNLARFYPEESTFTLEYKYWTLKDFVFEMEKRGFHYTRKLDYSLGCGSCHVEMVKNTPGEDPPKFPLEDEVQKKEIYPPELREPAPKVKAVEVKTFLSDGDSIPPPVVTEDYSVDCFVPYFRNLHLVSQTIDSILSQWNIKAFIHLVNDCSLEDDAELKHQFGSLPNVRFYKTLKNSGPYAIANSLFEHTVSPFIGIVDSDDVLLPTHFHTAITNLKESGKHAWGSSMRQFLNPRENHNERNLRVVYSSPIIDSGARPDCIPHPRLINGTMVIRKETFEALNGFDGRMFCGADTEFSQRMQFPSDIECEVYISREVTALRRVCSNSLSNSNARFGLRSPERDAVLKESVRRYNFWKSQDKINPREYGTLDSKGSVLDPNYKISFRRNDPVYFCMAAIPRRMYSLERTVESLLPQCDHLMLYLNDFSYVPDFLKHDKIQIVHGDNSRRGSTKFFWADKVRGFILTVDDDLIYPPDYAEAMTTAIDRYKCIVGAHGNKLKLGKIDNYHRDRTVLDGRKELKEDTFVDIIGTGTIGFHTDDIKICMADIDLPDMEDIAVFKHSYNHSYAKVIVAHPDGWLKSSSHHNDLGIYGDACVAGCELETEIINAHKNHR